jgi:dienelactone hydrolase
MQDLDEMYEHLSFSRLLNRIYAQTPRALAMDAHVHAADDVPEWQERLRAKCIELLGIDDMLADRGEITTHPGDDPPHIDGLIVEYYYIESWNGTWIPAYVLKPEHPAREKLPAFVCLHGHGESKETQVGRVRGNPHCTRAGIDLARMGYITISIDNWGWNERGFGPSGLDSAEGRFNLNMLLFGRTINGLRVFDAMRCVDYLLGRGDVDPERIGCIGLSLGGTLTMWTAALDTRVSLAVIEGFANTYKASIIDLSHCTCNYIPGLLKYAEMPDILGLIAPRPMCWVTGHEDTIFPLDAFLTAREKINSLYELLGAGLEFATHVHPGGHEYLGGPELDFIRDTFGDCSE